MPENPNIRPPTNLDTVHVQGLSPFGATMTYGLDRYGMDSTIRAGISPYVRETGEGGKDNASDGSGCGGPNPEKGDPIVIGTGNLVERELDFASEGEMGLLLQRQYTSKGGWGMFGKGWMSTFDRRLSFYYFEKWACSPIPGGANCDTAAMPQNVYAVRPDGRVIPVIIWNGGYQPANPNAKTRLVLGVDGAATLYTEENTVETYQWGRLQSVVNAHGVGWTLTWGGPYNADLVQVTHTNGRKIVFGWSGDNMVSATDPEGNVYQYGYASSEHGASLTSVTLPGAPTTTITYAYKPGTTQLAGKYVNGALLSEFAYDAGSRASMSQMAGGAERHDFAYTTDADGRITQVQETNPLGKKTDYAFQNHRLVSINGLASPHCPASFKQRTYDTYGYETSVTDFEGREARFTYAPSGQLQQQIEAYGTPLVRTTNMVWDPNANRLANVTVVGETSTDYVYGANNRLISIVVKNLSARVPASQNQTRTTTYAYTQHPNGMLATMVVDGPLTGAADALTYTYSTKGDLLEFKNSLSHKTTYSLHNELGYPGKVVGPNGATTTYLYDARGRIASSSEVIGGVAQPSTYTYDANGRLSAIQRPGGRSIHREYDGAGRTVLEYEPVAGGLYDVKRYTYNKASRVTSAIIQRTAFLHVPASPSTLTVPAIGANGNYTVGWSANGSAESYKLEENGGSGWSVAYTGAALSKAYSSKAAGVYSYRISACNAAGCTVSAAASVRALYTPALTAPATNTTGDYSVSWTAVAGATKYQLQERFNAGAWTQIHDASATSKAITDKVDGTYGYQVRACAAEGCASFSAVVNTVVDIVPPPAPTNFSYMPSYNPPPYVTTWIINWTNSPGAKRYELADGFAGGSSGYPAAHQIVRDGPPGGATFSLRACNGGGCSPWTTMPPSLAPTVTAPGSSANGSYTVGWTAVTIAATYKLEESANGGAWSAIQNTSALSRAVSGKSPGSYRYRASACNLGGCGPVSAIVTTVVSQPPAVPANFNPRFTTTQFPPISTTFTIGWSAVAGATSYELRKISTGTTVIYAGPNAGYSYNNGFGGPLEGGMIPKFSVRACNASGCSAWSAEVTASG